MSFKASQGISELNKNSIIDRVCLDFLGSLSVWENLGNMIFLGFTQGVPRIKSLFRDVGTYIKLFNLKASEMCAINFRIVP